MNTWNRHREAEKHGIGSGTKLLFTFLSLRFFDIRRERHNFINKRAANFVDPNWSHQGETKNWRPSSRLKSQHSHSEFKSQVTVFFQIPKSSALPGMTSFTSPVPFSYLGFLLWHLWLSHPIRMCVNTCTQCVHLTNPCTKQKVLGLTKPKGKIYKTKFLRNYITYVACSSVWLSNYKLYEAMHNLPTH